ncbi:unnamed protein product, partial [Mesorhabditis belari]|uniref:Uncharacterized protein n=1 Tax=Mesorhabditis belari TaxID=2138241 RepID=A0AAF3EW28_9BILA
MIQGFEPSFNEPTGKMIQTFVIGILLPFLLVFGSIGCSASQKAKSKERNESKSKREVAVPKTGEIVEHLEKRKELKFTMEISVPKPVANEVHVEKSKESKSTKEVSLPKPVDNEVKPKEPATDESVTTNTTTGSSTATSVVENRRLWRLQNREGLPDKSPIYNQKLKEIPLREAAVYRGNIDEKLESENDEWIQEIEAIDTNFQPTDTELFDREIDPNLRAKVNDKKCELWETRMQQEVE